MMGSWVPSTTQAQRAVTKAIAEADNEKEINSLKAKIDSVTAHLDKVYMDKLSGIQVFPEGLLQLAQRAFFNAGYIPPRVL